MVRTDRWLGSVFMEGEVLELASRVMIRVVGKDRGSVMTDRWYD